MDAVAGAVTAPDTAVQRHGQRSAFGRQRAQVVVVAADASTARPELERAGWKVVPMALEGPS